MNVEILTLSTDGMAIMPGHTCAMTARPQRCPLLPYHVVFGSLAEAMFAIVELKIGNRSAFRSAGYRVPIRGGRVEMLPEEISQWWSLEVIQTAMDFSLDVINVGRVASPFRAEWTCRVAPNANVNANTNWPSVARARMGDGAPMKDPEIQIGNPPPGLGLIDPAKGMVSYPAPEDLRGESHLDDVPNRQGPIERVLRVPGFGWDPHGDD